jgi:hypothetical protein
VEKTAPQPILRSLDEPALDRIAMDVAEFLDALGFAPDVEIIVAPLPERRAFRTPQLLRTICETPSHGETRFFGNPRVIRVELLLTL